ncbi:MAG: DUF116 domain-containing protein [Desulfovibrio sp.]|nr:DUF116 domain-containing protein [Desulfovibrio sp.]
MLRKSDFSLSPEHYGGARKRIFLGLMVGTCFLLCLVLTLFFILPWTGQGTFLSWLACVSMTLGFIGILILCWLCLTLVFHIYSGRMLPGISAVRHVTIGFFFPFMEALAKLLRMDKDLVRRSFIKVNNEFVVSRLQPLAPNALLVLLPHCVQRSLCPYRLIHNADNCRRCGQCPVAALLQLRDTYGFHLAIASGGTIARRIVVQTRPRCIIAVACERDLTSGIQDSYPVPVFGVLNIRPHGPCINTLVPLAALENAIRLVLNSMSLADFRRKSCGTGEVK